jgi:hypothetical protein
VEPVYEMSCLNYGDPLCIVELPFRQAWRAEPENFAEISKDRNVDFHIFTWENGCRFEQEIEVLNGIVTKDIVTEYDDYDWETAFNKLGG